jgi:Glycosyltransferase family 87
MLRDRLSPRGKRMLDVTLIAAAVILSIVGLFVFIFHLLTDPLADVHAYYDAGQRLNAGLPLYANTADVDSASFYRYPPLLAIIFRPLALLPFNVAALLWEVGIVAALGLTIRRLGLRRRSTWLALGILSAPIAWAVVIGQAQVWVTFFLTLGSPAWVALAAQLKLFPALVALYWLGRREWHALARFVGWVALLVAFQLVLEPAGTIAFLGTANLGQVGDVNNLSPFALSPLLWFVLAAAGLVVTLIAARTRVGWATAVTYSVLVIPRLLEYMLMTLLAALADPDPRSASQPEVIGVDDPR